MMLTSDLGRRVFGTAVLVSGLITLVSRSYTAWHVLGYVVAIAAALEVAAGAGLLFERSMNVAARTLVGVYVFFMLLCVPRIIIGPQVYVHWGNLFEQLAFFTGAALIAMRAPHASALPSADRAGRWLLGLCTISFAIEQALYLKETASLVPSWLPPSQTFWAIVTTMFFGLAAIAFLIDRAALLAARLLTAMLAGFGALVWLPILATHTGNAFDWSETAETFAIAGVAWILADVLQRRDHRLSAPEPA